VTLYFEDQFELVFLESERAYDHNWRGAGQLGQHEVLKDLFNVHNDFGVVADFVEHLLDQVDHGFLELQLRSALLGHGLAVDQIFMDDTHDVGDQRGGTLLLVGHHHVAGLVYQVGCSPSHFGLVVNGVTHAAQILYRVFVELHQVTASKTQQEHHILCNELQELRRFRFVQIGN